MVSVAVLVWVVAGLAWLASIVNIIATTMTKHAHTISRKAKIIAKTRGMPLRKPMSGLLRCSASQTASLRSSFIFAQSSSGSFWQRNRTSKKRWV